MTTREGTKVKGGLFVKVRGKADTTEASQVQRTSVTQESILKRTGLLLQVQRGCSGK